MTSIDQWFFRQHESENNAEIKHNCDIIETFHLVLLFVEDKKKYIQYLKIKYVCLFVYIQDYYLCM